MSRLTQYLGENKDKAYSFAASNTTCNAQGRPIVLKNDEWISETEWDDLFTLLSDKTKKS